MVQPLWVGSPPHSFGVWAGHNGEAFFAEFEVLTFCVGFFHEFACGVLGRRTQRKLSGVERNGYPELVAELGHELARKRQKAFIQISGVDAVASLGQHADFRVWAT